MGLKEQIEKYKPYNEQEELDKKQMLDFIEKFDDVLTRKNIFGHFSSSALVVNKERTKIVVVYHNIFDGYFIDMYSTSFATPIVLANELKHHKGGIPF